SISASCRIRGTVVGRPTANAKSATVFPITGSSSQPNVVWAKEEDRELSSSTVTACRVSVSVNTPTSSSPGSTSNPIPEGLVQPPKTKRLINKVNKSLV